MEQFKKHKWWIVAICFVLFVVYAVETAPIQAFELLVDGRQVAYIKDKEIAENYIEKMKDTYSESGKYEVDQVNQIAFEGVKVPESDIATEDKLSEILDENINFNLYGYTIKIDDESFFTLKRESEAEALLEKIKKQYVTEDVDFLEIDFVENVEILKAQVKKIDISDYESVWAAYESGKEERLTYKVEKGDTTWDIASRFGLSIEEIALANSDKDLTKLQIGQEVNLNLPKVWINVRTVAKKTEELPIIANTYYEKVDTMYVGDYKLKEQGQDGLKKVEVETTYVNGILENEQILQEVVVKEPTSTIMMTGTKWKEVTASGEFNNPANGKLTSRFGTRWGRMHEGIDIGAPVGTAIRAADAGVVISAKYISGYGNTVILDHGNGINTLYGHASELLVVVGQTVEKNELIARVGRTGSTTGSCLHFEVRRNGQPIDPLPYLNY